MDVGLEFSTICSKFGDLVSSDLQVIEGRKTPKNRCISKPSIPQTTKAKTSKLGSQLVIALRKTCAKFRLFTYLGSKKKKVRKIRKLRKFKTWYLLTHSV